MDFTEFVLIIIAIFMFLLIAAILAALFYEVAVEKGFPQKKYLWIPFLFGFAGYLLVIALPDRRNSQQVANDELPDI